MSNQHELPDFSSDPLFVADIIDDENELQGWVAVDTLSSLGSCGGIRLYPDVTREEVKALARGMTLKYCFHQIHIGGAKGGLRLPFDLSPQERAKKLQIFGRHIAPLINNGIYNPWTDMNCNGSDLENIFAGAGHGYYPVKGDSSYYTALSTYSGVLAVCKHLNLSVDKTRIAIEGIGNVGGVLAEEIKRTNAILIAASNRLGGVHNENGLNVDEIFAAKKTHGENWVLQNGNWQNITAPELFDTDMDILIPSARTFSIDKKIATKVKCKAVVPAANSPCTNSAINIFKEKDIILMPFFVTNSGGVTGPGLENLGDSDENIRKLYYENFYNMYLRLLEKSKIQNRSSFEIAMDKCRTFIPQHSKITAENRSFSKRAVGWLHRKIITKLSRQLEKTKNHHIKILNDAFYGE